MAQASLVDGSVDVYYGDGGQKVYRTYDLVLLYGGRVTVLAMEWGTGDKLAIVVDQETSQRVLGPKRHLDGARRVQEVDLNRPKQRVPMVMVLELGPDRAPVQIEIPEGVDSIAWIPASSAESPESDPNSSEGAYTGSTQLAVFTKLRLQLQVYSLDCSHVLFTIPKPLSLILVHPVAPIWSVLVLPYFGKNSNVMAKASADSNPILLHFHNLGPVSKLIYRLRLPMAPLTSPQLAWSPSGRWLLCFNDTDSLFGYDLLVFNALGIFKKSIRPDSDAVVNADSVLNLHWLTEGIVDDVSASSLVSYGSSSYFARWTQFAGDTESLLIANQDSNSFLECCVVSTANFKIVHRKSLLGNTISSVWKRHDNHSFRNRLVSLLSLSDYGELLDVKVVLNVIVFRFHHLLLVYEVLSQPEMTWEFTAAIDTSSCIISVDHRIINDELYLFVASTHRIIAYNVPQKTLRVLHSNGTRIKSCQIVDTESHARFVVSDDVTESSLHPWHLVTQTINDDTNKENEEGELENKEDDSNLEIMNKYEYKEEDSKVVNLMNDVQHSEWGTRARFRRNRFSDVSLGIPFNDRQRPNYLSNINSDDITDTFNLRKRQRN